MTRKLVSLFPLFLVLVLPILFVSVAWAQAPPVPGPAYPLGVSVTLALGGALGAVIRRLRATDEGNAWKLYATDVLVAAVSLPLLQLVGAAILPEAYLAAVAGAPAIAFCVAASLSYMGIDLLTPLSKGWQGKRE